MEQEACQTEKSRPREDSAASFPLAPRWHTALLAAAIVAVAVAGTLLTRFGASVPRSTGASTGPSGIGQLLLAYAPLLVVQWGLVFYVARVGQPRSILVDLLAAEHSPWRGGRTSRLRAAAVDVALAGITAAAVIAIEVAFAKIAGTRRDASVAALVPRTAATRAAWIVVAASVGFCEEVVYRGYMQKHLAAWTGSVALGVALSALLFGLAHLEQGPAAAGRIAIYGLLFAVVAVGRRSLVPAILAHVAIDVLPVFAR